MVDRQESALHKLRGGVSAVLDAASEGQRRERIGARILSVQRELVARRKRQHRIGLAMSLAALVGSVVAALLWLGPGLTEPPRAPEQGVVRLVAGAASLLENAALAPLRPGELSLSGGSLLVTPPEGSAELRLSSDTAISVSPATELGISRQRPTPEAFEERVLLRAGSVALRVPKLGTRGKVSVQTEDALVEVHGTQFSVRVVKQPPLESFTEVEVREGRVSVRSGERLRFLGAGERWSSKREPPEVSAPPPAPEPEPAPPPGRRRKTPDRSSPDRPSPALASELAAQNRLLESAQLAQKSGMPGLALERLDTLIARYPSAELAHNARVERFRILQFAGREREAVLAAKAYLEQHPDGFARDEAERLIQMSSIRTPSVGSP